MSDINNNKSQRKGLCHPASQIIRISNRNSNKLGRSSDLGKDDDDRVKDLGRKARARLQAERDKRRGIVRLTTEDATIMDARIPESLDQQQLNHEQHIRDADADKQDILPMETNPAPSPPPFTTKPNRKRNNSTKSPFNAKRSRKSNIPKPKRKKDESADTWMPDISHLTKQRVIPDCSTRQCAAHKEDQNSIIPVHAASNVVQLHGLPIGASVASIRRFFSGLNPVQVVMLLPHNASIRSIDATGVQRSPRTKRRGHRHHHHRQRVSTMVTKTAVSAAESVSASQIKSTIPRYEPHQLRVLVKFESTFMAQLAVQRSGERITVMTTTVLSPSSSPMVTIAAAAADAASKQPHSTQQQSSPPIRSSSSASCSIGVTPLSKPLAKHLINKLAVIANPAHASLEMSLQQVKELDPLIGKILWSTAFQVLKLVAKKTKRQTNPVEEDNRTAMYHPFSCSLWDERGGKLTPQGIEELKSYRSIMKDDLTRLRSQLVYPKTQAVDPELTDRQPAIRLIQLACDALQFRIDRIDECLLLQQRWRLFRSSPFRDWASVFAGSKINK